MEETTAGSSQEGASADAAPPFDPLVPAVPVSYPLKTLEELESRAYFKSFHYSFNQAQVKLQPAGGDGVPPRRRILVCHDMAGGYTDDRYVQGGKNADAYSIWHWYLIDVFVYFSHDLVTLPPPCWTNTAHRHGVKINMEVNLDPGQIPNLKAFVSYLSETMHSALPGSLVIWYDSVTVDGELSWQNQLNDKNKPFFDLCDGIFVNYSWEKDFPKLSADVAGDRKFDVYMGIDVFGRGTYGGGQWTTNIALDVIKKNDVSAAIFAPGWIYETKQPPDFQTAQSRWWGLVEKSWGTVQNYPKILPFYSNFDQGRGYHIYIEGEQVSDTPWNNISSQSFQPFIEYSEDSTTQPIQVSINLKEASYNGGGNISFVGTLDDGAEFTARLFEGELLLGNSPVDFTYSVKSSRNSLLGLALVLSSATDERKSVLLAASGNTLLTMNQFSSRYTTVIMPRQVTKAEGESKWILQESRLDMAGHTLEEIRAVCYRSKLEKSAEAVSNTLSDGPSEYYAILGDIKITTAGDNSKFPPSDSWLVDGQFVSWTSGSQGSKLLSVKIMWQLKVGNADPFPKYNIYVDKITSTSSGNQNLKPSEGNKYLGVTVAKSFYVADLEVPSGISSLKFMIQVCGLDGACQKLEDSPFLLLQVDGS
ncbi:UNVERIFIED_CONTAM: Cytosolic endo-beta-N-acetylglucosaminidase 1 [Sesamum radiatum]|uniref:mannosyl-glycoprotein endo-beta-N-acetylglucosaminidase n=1 Tax=Sesamum radiatum TaxID=300843 RepID=A0AAW2JXD5_SESRA